MINSGQMHPRYGLPIRNWECATKAVDPHGERFSRGPTEATSP